MQEVKKLLIDKSLTLPKENVFFQPSKKNPITRFLYTEALGLDNVYSVDIPTHLMKDIKSAYNIDRKVFFFVTFDNNIRIYSKDENLIKSMIKSRRRK